MKISDNHTFYIGAKYQEGLQELQNQTKKAAGNTVFAGTLNDDLFQYDILKRKKEAQEKAMQLIGDAFAGDLTIDEDLQKRCELVDELEAENLDLQKQINEVDEEQKQLMEKYGVTEDSVEQQELELLRKSRKNKLTCGALTPEERKQVVEINARGLTEYQQRQLEKDDIKEVYYDKMTENNRTIRGENAVIRGTKLERLKYNPMSDAKEQAEEIKEAASDEIVGMVVDAAREQIDKEQEEREEQAEKIKEERKEQEALIEKRQEKNREQEEMLETVPVEEMVQLDRIQSEVQKEVKNIVNKMKLVAEDIKGAAVDQTV